MSTNTNEVLSSKRRRSAATSTNMRINDLPDGILTNVATYLATPSVVLFAIAIQQDGTSSTQTQIMSATTSTSNGGEQQLNVLDFSDIEKKLAAKLTDDHITTILTRIDSSNNLKTLKLAGCINITGSCLEVIHSSGVLELLDLSLVGKHESPILDTEPLLSESAVIPILDSMRGRRKLKLLHLPKTFRTNQSTAVEQFLERYNQYLSSFEYKCSKCETICDDTGFHRWIIQGHEDENYEGNQNYTCSGCLSHFCFNDCVDDYGEEYIFWCEKCENHYCKECMTSNECRMCFQSYCNKCDALEKVCEDFSCETNLCEGCIQESTCRHCNQTRCKECIRSYSCGRDGCNKVICGDCVESKGEGGKCHKCTAAFCSSECRYLKCSRDWERACPACIKESAISFRRKYQESQKEMEELSQGMEDL